MLEPGDDLALVSDGLKPVSLLRPGSSAVTPIGLALRQALRIQADEETDAQHGWADVVWHVPASQAAEGLQPGDVLVEADGRRWTLLRTRLTALDSRWRCVGRDLALAHGLDQYVDIEKATFAKSDGGADVPAWHVWRTGLPARIEATGREVRTEQGRQFTLLRAKVFLTEAIELDHTCRIRAADGSIYTVLGIRGAPSLGMPMEVDAEASR